MTASTQLRNRMEAALMGKTIVATCPRTRTIATSTCDVIEITEQVTVGGTDSRAFVTSMASLGEQSAITEVHFERIPNERVIRLFISTANHRRLVLAAVSMFSVVPGADPAREGWLNPINVTWGTELVQAASDDAWKAMQREAAGA